MSNIIKIVWGLTFSLENNFHRVDFMAPLLSFPQQCVGNVCCILRHFACRLKFQSKPGKKLFIFKCIDLGSKLFVYSTSTCFSPCLSCERIVWGIIGGTSIWIAQNSAVIHPRKNGITLCRVGPVLYHGGDNLSLSGGHWEKLVAVVEEREESLNPF